MVRAVAYFPFGQMRKGEWRFDGLDEKENVEFHCFGCGHVTLNIEDFERGAMRRD